MTLKYTASVGMDTIMGILDAIGNLFKSPGPEAPRPLVGRNDPCWCGSGRKYKKCHLDEDESKNNKARAACCTTPT